MGVRQGAVLLSTTTSFRAGRPLDARRPRGAGRARPRAAGSRAGLGGQPRHHARSAAVTRAADDVRRGWAARRDRAGMDGARAAASSRRGGWAGASSSIGWTSRPRASGWASSTRCRSSTSARWAATYDDTADPRPHARRSSPNGASTTGARSSARLRPGGRGSADHRGSPDDGSPGGRTRPAASTDLLVDHWYSHAVGHVIEALRRCQGYAACDPELRISLVLNGASPTELAPCAPFVAETFGVPYTSFGVPVGSPRRALRRIPRDWDHVVHHPAATDPAQLRFEGLRRYYEAAGRHFRGRRTVGVAGATPPPVCATPETAALPPRARARGCAPGARRTARGRGDACRERSAVPLPVDRLVALDARRARPAVPDVGFAFVGMLSITDHDSGERPGRCGPR